MPVDFVSVVSSTFLAAGPVSANIEIPAGGTIALISNLSQTAAFLATGSSSSVAAVVREGLPVLPGQSVSLAVTSAGGVYLAAVTQYEAAGLVVTVGN